MHGAEGRVGELKYDSHFTIFYEFYKGGIINKIVR